MSSISGKAGESSAGKAGHTPGPWTASNERRGIFEIEHDGHLLAQVFRVTFASGELPAEANANLMAAAPELLAQLIAYVEREEYAAPYSSSPMRERSREIIAKAEGGQS